MQFLLARKDNKLLTTAARELNYMKLGSCSVIIKGLKLLKPVKLHHKKRKKKEKRRSEKGNKEKDYKTL